MYTTTWSITGTGGASPQCLSRPGFNDLPTSAYPPDDDYSQHTVYVQNRASSAGPVFVGARNPDGGGLPAVGWELAPGENFSITLTRDSLWVDAPASQTADVTFLVVRH